MAAVSLTVVLCWAHPVCVGQHWWPLSHGSHEVPAVKGAVCWGVSVYSSVVFPPRKVARSLGSEDASPKSLPRLNWTCLCTGSKGRHSATGLCGEGGLPSACMGALPLHIWLLDSHCWGWRLRSFREWFSHLSMGWERRGLVDGDECLMGQLGEVSMHDSEGEGLWHCCDSLPWVSLLHLDQGCWPLDWDYLIEESSLRHLTTSAPPMRNRGHRSVSDPSKWVQLVLVLPWGPL